MKIRKNTKAKVQPTADFSKKKSKVGRKVKRENVTKISLKSKAIHMPTQAIQRRSSLQEDEHSIPAKSAVSSISRDVVNHLMKELHHYSAPNRLRALSELSSLLATRADADQWISILIPEVIELLLDIEREPRLAVIDIFKVIVQRYKLPALRNIAPVVMKYICSGLSNIHKGVRKQALILLSFIAQEGGRTQQVSGGQLIQPYLRSISDILISLLTESLTASFTPTSFEVSKTSSGEGKNMESLFSLLLKTLSVVLQTGAQSPSALSSSPVADSNPYAVEVDMFRAAHPSTGVLFIHASFHKSTWLKSVDHISGIDPSSIASGTITQLYKHMNTILSGVVVDSNLLSMDKMLVLDQVLEIILLLVRGYWHSSTDGLIDFISSAFAQFPFACLESSLAEPGSQTELRGKRAASKLNSTICELIFAIPLSSLNDGATAVVQCKDQILDKIEISAEYTVNELQRLVHRFDTLRLKNNSTSTASQSHDHTLDNEIVSKLFLCLTVMLTTECPVDFENLLSRFRDFQLSIVKPIISGSVSKASAPEKLLRKAIACIHGPMCSSICEIIRRASVVDYLGNKYFESSEPFCLLFECAITMLKSSALKQYSYLVESSSQVDSSGGGGSGGGSVHSSKGLHATEEQRAIGCLIESIHILLVRKCSTILIPTHIAQSLCETIQLFFTFSTAKEGSAYSHGTLYDGMHDSCVYRLFDIYYHAPLTGEDMPNLSKVMLTALSNSHVSLDHQSYFLRLLFERRKELELDEFVSLLVSGVVAHSLSCAESNTSTTTDDCNNRCIVQQFVREVSTLLFWSASSEAPQNLLQLLLPVWSEVVDTVVNVDSQNISFCVEQNDDSTATKQTRLYNCYNVCVAVLILAEPWLISMGGSLDRETSEDGRLGDESLAVFQLCETVSRVCFAVLVNFRDFEVVGNKLQTAFLKPLANILTISNGADFFVLEAFLVCLSTVSDEGVELGCESSSRIVAQSTLHLMSHLFIEIRSAFNSVAFSMKKKKFSTVCKIEAIVRAIRSRKLFQRKSRVFIYSDIVGLQFCRISTGIFMEWFVAMCSLGDINGNVYGRIIGNVNGNISDQVSGIVDGSVRGDINGDVSGIIKGDVTGIINSYVTGSVEGKVGGGTSSLHPQKDNIQIQNKNVDTKFEDIQPVEKLWKLEAIYLSHCARIKSMKVKDVKAEIARLNHDSQHSISIVGLGAKLKENLMSYYRQKMLDESSNLYE